MWHTMNWRNRMVWIPVLMCLLGIGPGCITESVDYFPEEGKERQIITFSMTLPEPAPGITRAITYEDECRVDDIHLLLFDRSTGGYVDAYEGVNISPGDYTNEKTFSAELPYGTFDILIVGNCKTTLTGAGLTEGDTREQVKNKLIYRMPPGAWGYNSPETLVPFVPFPFYGEVLNQPITPAGGSINGIPVVRMVARIDVHLQNSVVQSYGKLVSVRLYNSNTAGQIIPNQGAYGIENDELVVYSPSIPVTATPSPLPLLYRVQDPGLELTYSIYTPEAVVGSPDGLENTCLVLGIGNKEDSGGGAVTRAGIADSTYYYRVDFRNSMTGTLMPLLRNHAYRVRVNSIINRGFPDPDQAYRSKPYGLDYTVQEWELHEQEVDIDPTIYRLDISSTFLEINRRGTTSVEIQISTTHPDGWSAYLSSSPTEIIVPDNYWLYIWRAYNENEYIPSLNNSTVVKNIPTGKVYNLEIVGDDPGVGDGQYALGYIHIVSGNLTNVITVKRHGWDQD